MSVDVVVEVKNDLVAAGVDILGPCGAFKITNEVALTLGAKVIKKTGGVNCGERSIDGLIVGTKFVDILISAGGNEDAQGNPIPGTGNVPAWQERDATPDEMARAVDPTPSPDHIPTDPIDPRVDPTPTTDLGAIEKALQGVKDALLVLTDKVGQIGTRVDTLDLKVDALSAKKAPDYQGTGSVGPFSVKVTLTPKPT